MCVLLSFNPHFKGCSVSFFTGPTQSRPLGLSNRHIIQVYGNLWDLPPWALLAQRHLWSSRLESNMHISKTGLQIKYLNYAVYEVLKSEDGQKTFLDKQKLFGQHCVVFYATPTAKLQEERLMTSTFILRVKVSQLEVWGLTLKFAIMWLPALSSTHFLLVGHSVLFFGVVISNSSSPSLKIERQHVFSSWLLWSKSEARWLTQNPEADRLSPELQASVEDLLKELNQRAVHGGA